MTQSTDIGYGAGDLFRTGAKYDYAAGETCTWKITRLNTDEYTGSDCIRKTQPDLQNLEVNEEVKRDRKRGIGF